MYAEGISHASLVLDIASEAGIIDKSGAWYSYNGQKIGQGRENAKLYLKDSPALMAEVEEKVKALLGVGPREVITDSRGHGASRSAIEHRLDRIEPGRSSPATYGTRKLPSEQATAPRSFLSAHDSIEQHSNAPKRSTYERAPATCSRRAPGRRVELRRLLIKKGEPEADVDAAIERLRASGLLDDANFARQLTRSKALGAGLARRRIAQELTKRGVAREVSTDGDRRSVRRRGRG